MNILFFDTETTGFPKNAPLDDPEQPYIVQLAARLTTDRAETLAEMNYLALSPVAVPERAAEIHGITDAKLALGGFAPRTVLSMFLMLMGRADLRVAHNLQFDSKLLDIAIAREALAGVEDVPGYCTMLAAQRVMGMRKWPKLIEAHHHFLGRGFDNAHDAMADVNACQEVYFAMNPVKPRPDDETDRAARERNEPAAPEDPAAPAADHSERVRSETPAQQPRSAAFDVED